VKTNTIWLIAICAEKDRLITVKTIATLAVKAVAKLSALNGRANQRSMTCQDTRG
jgi:hypothetical protein